MMARAVIAGVLVLAGCAQTPAPVVRPAPGNDLSKLTVIGPWSEPIDGLICRVLIDRDRGQETDSVLAAFQIRNTSALPVKLNAAGLPATAAVSWKMDGARMIVSGPEPAAGNNTVEIAPNENVTTEPAQILVPPGAGKRKLVAGITHSDKALVSGAAAFEVAPAQWGEGVNGIRLRVAGAKKDYSVGQQPRLHIFVQNLTQAPVTVRAVDWSGARADSRGDVLTIYCRSDDSAYGTVAPGDMWVRPVEMPLLLAPGKYRLRLVLDQPELPAGSRPAWHGIVSSNDAALVVSSKSQR